jgi:hypothetical protein
MNTARAHTVAVLAKAGIDLPQLPLTATVEPRDQQEILDRLCCLHASAACAYGFNRSAALQWLVQEGLSASLTESETKYLRTGAGDLAQFQAQIEAMWTLCWCLSLVDVLDFWSACDDDFVYRLPDLKVGVPSATMRERATLRNAIELTQANDLAFCLHWVGRDAQLIARAAPAAVDLALIRNRRKALEWVSGRELWDATTLDT